MTSLQSLPRSSNGILPVCLCLQVTLLSFYKDTSRTGLKFPLICSCYTDYITNTVSKSWHNHRYHALGLQRPFWEQFNPEQNSRFLFLSHLGNTLFTLIQTCSFQNLSQGSNTLSLSLSVCVCMCECVCM